MNSVTHHGRETAYLVSGGDGDAEVLYVHGSGGTHGLWAAQYGGSGPAHPAAALDLGGHGASEDVGVDAGPRTLDAYARDVAAVARETGAAVLVGNSLGGAVILWTAVGESPPDADVDPAALVLAGTGAKLAVSEDLREWLDGDFERAVDALHGDDALFHDADERVVERSKATMRETGSAVTRRDFLSCHSFDVRERIGTVDVPALAVVGEHDRLTPPAYHEYLADHLPRGEYAEIPDAAHLAMVERPAAFNERVRAFLDRTDPVG